MMNGWYGQRSDLHRPTDHDAERIFAEWLAPGQRAGEALTVRRTQMRRAK
jgi:hypothetical protein